MKNRTTTLIWFGIVTFLFIQNISAEIEDEFEDESDQTLEIPALARTVGMGHMYDARSNTFYNSNIFTVDLSKILKTSVRTTIQQTPSIYDLESDKIAQIFDALNIRGSTAMRILTGQEEIHQGIASKLLESVATPDSSCLLRNFTDILLYTNTAEIQNLDFSSPETLEYINENSLYTHNASHAVTSITWGVSLAVKVSSESKEMQFTVDSGAKEAFEQELYKLTYKLGSGKGIANYSSFNLTYSVHIKDISSDPESSNVERRELLSQLLKLIENTNINQDKGIPLSYTLTPIKTLLDLKKSPANRYIHRSPKINDDIVDKLVDIFDSAPLKVKESACKFNYRTEQCQHPPTLLHIRDVLLNSLSSYKDFRALVTQTYLNVQNGTSQVSELSRLIQRYHENGFDFSPENVLSKVQQVENITNKMTTCSLINSNSQNFHYFGLSQVNLEATILENKHKVIYIFIEKLSHEEDEVRWNNNYQIFTNTLNKPFNTLFYVDCTLFNFTECLDVNQTVIKQMIKGQFTLNDVADELNKVEEDESLQPLRISALGRNAHIGALFDARNEIFLRLGILKINPEDNVTPLYPVNLPRFEAKVQVHSIKSETLGDRFAALDVDTDTRFMILGKILPLTKSGLYFTSEEEYFFPVQSILHSYAFGIKEIRITDTNFNQFFKEEQLLDSGKATHFFSKIEYGCNTIFTLVSQKPPSEEGKKAVGQMKRIVQTLLRRIKPKLLSEDFSKFGPTGLTFIGSWSRLTPVLFAEESAQLDSLMAQFQIKIKVYSDAWFADFSTKQIEIENLSQFQDFMVDTYIPQLKDCLRRYQYYPIAYVLHPIRSLGPEIGFISPTAATVSFGSLRNSQRDLQTIESIFNSFEVFKKEIYRFKVLLQENPENATDGEMERMQDAERSLKVASKTFEQSLRNIIVRIKLGKAPPSVLEDYLKEFKSKSRFLIDNNYRIEVHEKLAVERKLDAVQDALKTIDDSLSNVNTHLEFLKYASCLDKSSVLQGNVQLAVTESQNIGSIMQTLQAKNKSVAKPLLHDVKELGCGGIIRTPITEEPFVVQYKLNRSYDPNEKCLWTVENTEKSFGTLLTLRVELVSNGFKGNTGLFVYKWNRQPGLSSEEITSEKEYELSAESLHFSFTSDNETTTLGTGFTLRIAEDVTRSARKAYKSNLFFRNFPGNYSVSSYQSREEIFITVNPNSPMNFSVNRINELDEFDRLRVYAIQGLGKYALKGTLRAKTQKPVSFFTSDPVLSIITLDESPGGEWFNISWN